MIANTELALQGMGLVDANGSPLDQAEQASGGIWSRVRGLFKRKRQTTHDDDEDEDDILPPFKLPRIDPALIPKSVDREQLEAEAMPSGPSNEEAQGALAGSSRPDATYLGARNPNLRIHVPTPADDELAEDV